MRISVVKIALIVLSFAAVALIARCIAVSAMSEQLHMAVKNGDYGKATFCIRFGADINYSHGHGLDTVTPLFSAIMNRDNQMVEMLLSMGADPHLPSGHESSPIFFAAKRGNSTAFFLLEKYGAKVGPYLMYPAVSGGSTEIVQYMLDSGVDPNTMFATCTPLHVATTPDMALLLLDYGAKIDAKDDEGKTPMHYAARRERVDVCQLLLKNGADANALDNSLRTPLHMTANDSIAWAETAGIACAKLLLLHGAKVNAQDSLGETPLHYAVKNNYLGVAKELLAHGADVHIKNNDGKTPLDLLKSPGGPMGEMLLDAVATSSTPTTD